jgi:hypothetical protein
VDLRLAVRITSDQPSLVFCVDEKTKKGSKGAMLVSDGRGSKDFFRLI